MTEMVVCDLDEHRICNFVLGKSLEPGGVKGVEIYKNIKEGWYIASKNGIVVTIFLCMKEGYQGYSSFKGEVVKGGRNIRINENSSPEEIDRLFGIPEDFFEDEVSISRRFKINGELIEFDWGTQGDMPKLRYCSLEL